MTVTTIRPNGDVANSNTAPSATLPFSSTVTTVTADVGNDGTYVVLSSGQHFFTLDLGTFTVSATEAIARVRVRPRWKSNGNGYSVFSYSLVDPAGNQSPADSVFEKRTVAFATDTGGWRTTAPDGGAWTQAKLDALRVSFLSAPSFSSQTAGEGSTATNIAEIYVEVETNARPTLTMSAPAASVTDTQRPTITGAYADTDADPLDAYEIKVFDSATYSAGGFSPDTATPTWTSGITAATGTSVSVAPSVSLPNGTMYGAYMRVRQGGSIMSQWSAWSNRQFAIAVTPANAPTLTATADSTNARVALVITGTGPALVSGVRRFEVEREVSTGVWEAVKRTATIDIGNYSFTNQTQAVAVYDYESVRGVAINYRARVRSELATGAVSVSAWTTTASPVTVTRSGWRLKSTLDPASNISLNVHSESIESSSDERVGVFYPLGRANPVVLSDAIGGETMSLDLAFLDDASYVAFKALRAQRRTLLLQSPYGHHMYVRVGANVTASFDPHPSGIAKRVVKASFLEVDAP